MGDLLALESRCPPQGPVCWPVFATPVDVSFWSRMLQGHPDPRFSKYILSGLSQGFRIGFDRSHQLRSVGRNHPSAIQHQEVVAGQLVVEIEVGRILPVQPFLSRFVQCSPLGLVPKSHGAGGWRLIVDLSSPTDRSVNDGISSEYCSLKYASVDNVVHSVLSLGRGTMMAKIDLKNAYRIIPVHPHDHHLLGICWDDSIYID